MAETVSLVSASCRFPLILPSFILEALWSGAANICFAIILAKNQAVTCAPLRNCLIVQQNGKANLRCCNELLDCPRSVFTTYLEIDEAMSSGICKSSTCNSAEVSSASESSIGIWCVVGPSPPRSLAIRVVRFVSVPLYNLAHRKDPLI